MKCFQEVQEGFFFFMNYMGRFWSIRDTNDLMGRLSGWAIVENAIDPLVN